MKLLYALLPMINMFIRHGTLFVVLVLSFFLSYNAKNSEIKRNKIIINFNNKMSVTHTQNEL